MEDEKTIEYFRHKEEIIGLCIRHGHKWSKTEFLTPNDFYQQIGLLYFNEDREVRIHAHYKVPRTINYTTEVLLCVSGQILFTFYDTENDWREIAKCEIMEGDVLCIFNVGHGARAIKPTRIIEIKQGPYMGVEEKYFRPDIIK